MAAVSRTSLVATDEGSYEDVISENYSESDAEENQGTVPDPSLTSSAQHLSDSDRPCVENFKSWLCSMDGVARNV